MEYQSREADHSHCSWQATWHAHNADHVSISILTRHWAGCQTKFIAISAGEGHHVSVRADLPDAASCICVICYQVMPLRQFHPESPTTKG